MLIISDYVPALIIAYCVEIYIIMMIYGYCYRFAILGIACAYIVSNKQREVDHEGYTV
jgi:hypothetical protein